ncbi:MAG: CARDB domain-containing protein [Chloroflexota bacterium]
MKKTKGYRWVAMLVIVALFSAAFLCGRGTGVQPGVLSPTDVPAGPVDTPDLGGGGGGEKVRPDLQVANTTVENTGAQREVRVTVVVRNRNAGTVGSDFTVVWFPHEKTDVVGCSWDISAAQVNQGPVTVNCRYTYDKSGEMHWRVLVDTEDEVGEADETNNERNGVVQIGGGGGQVQLIPPTNCKWKLASVPRNIILTWDYNGPGNIDGFIIYMGTTSMVKRVGPGARDYMVMDLDLDVQYHFDVRTFVGNQETQVDACSVDATTGH